MCGRRNWAGWCFQGRTGANRPVFYEIGKVVEARRRVREGHPSSAFPSELADMQGQQLHWRQGNFAVLGQCAMQRRTDAREVICEGEGKVGRGGNSIASTFIKDDIKGRIASQGGHLVPGSQVALLPVHGLTWILLLGLRFSAQAHSLGGKVHVLQRVSRKYGVAAAGSLHSPRCHWPSNSVPGRHPAASLPASRCPDPNARLAACFRLARAGPGRSSLCREVPRPSSATRPHLALLQIWHPKMRHHHSPAHRWFADVFVLAMSLPFSRTVGSGSI